VNLIATSPRDSIALEFRVACADLAQAQRAVLAKDTPGARGRVSQCAAAVDALLDSKNATVYR
jgi:hypothetical protein